MTKRMMRKRLGEDGLTEAQYLCLAHGAYFAGADAAAYRTPAERRALWIRHKAAVLDRWMAALRTRGAGWAGKRPAAFFDELEVAGHTRRKTGTGRYWGPWTKDGPPTEETEYDLIENDWQFLNRLGLLEPWERAAGDPESGKGIFE